MEENNTREKSDAEKHILIAVFGYIFFFPPLIGGAYKTSPFARFHFNQTLIILVCSLIGLAFFIFAFPYILYASTFWGIISFLLIVCYNFFLQVSEIIGIINAATGKMKRLPIIGGFNVIKLNTRLCTFCEKREAVIHFDGNNRFDEGDYCAKCVSELNLH
jgi:uncharacterized membrane protein